MKERIREIRKNLRLTMEEFGKRLGVTKVTISRLESGVNNVTDQMFTSICREFNINEDWLRNGTGNMFKEKDFEVELMEWAGRTLGGSSTAFKKGFVSMLMRLKDDEWLLLQEKLREILENTERFEALEAEKAAAEEPTENAAD